MANMNMDGQTARNLEKGYETRNKIKNVNKIFDTFQTLNTSTLAVANKKRFRDKALPEEGLKAISKLQEYGYFDAIYSSSILNNNKISTGNQIQEIAINVLDTLPIQRIPGEKINTNRIQSQIDRMKSRVINNGESFFSFDVETLGGVDDFGSQRLDHMLSYTFTEMDKDGVKNVFESVIGIDKDKGAELTKVVNRALKKPRSARTSYETVVLDQLSIIGHEDTVLDEYSEGLFKLSSAPEVLVSNEKRAKEGIRRLVEDVNPKQVAMDGSKNWEKQIANMVTKMNSQDNIFTAYNAAFDINVIKQVIGRTDTPVFKGLQISPQSELDVFDPFLANKFIAGRKGAQYLYNRDNPMIPSLGALQQESLARHYVPEVYEQGLAHVSSTDTLALGRLLTKNMTVGGQEGTTYLDFLSREFASSNTEKAVDIERGQLYFTKETQMFQGKNPLSFIYDPASSSYKTVSGYDVRGTTVKTKGFEQTAYKRGALYNIEHKMFSSQFADKIIQKNPEMQSVLGDITGNKHLLIMTPVDPLDKTGLVAQKQTFMFFDTAQEVESALSNTTLAGTWDSNEAMSFENINDITKYRREKELDRMKIAIGTPESIVQREASLQDLAEMSHNRFVNDTASRNIRDINFTNLASRLDRHRIIKELGGADAVAEAMINNKHGESIFKNPKVLGAFSISNKNGKRMLSETLMNAVNTFDYMDSTEVIYRSVYDEVMSLTSTLEKGRTTSMKRNLMFKEGIDRVFNSIPDTQKRIKVPVDSMNKLQINVGGILKGTMGRNILDVNLDYGTNILTKAHKLTGEVGDINRAGGYNVLQQLMGIQQQAGFENVFEGIDLESYANQGRSAKVVAEEMTSRLRVRVNEKRASDFMFGRIDVANMYKDSISRVDLSGINVREMVKGSLNDLNMLNILDTSDTPNIVRELMNQFDQIDYSDFKKNISFLGSEEQEFLMGNISRAKSELSEMYTDFAKGLNQANLTLALDSSKKGGLKIIDAQGRVVDMALPGLKTKGSNIAITLGRNEYSLANYLQAYKYQSSGLLGDITTETNIAAGTRGTMSFQKAIAEASKRGEDPVKYLKQTISRKSVGIMDKSVLLERINPKAFRNQFEVNMEEIVQIIPELLEDDKFMYDLYQKSVKNEAGLPGIITDADKFKDYMKSILSRQNSLDKQGLDRAASFGAIDATSRSALAMNMKNIAATIADYNQYDAVANRILKNVGINIRDKRIGKGVFSVFDPIPSALGGLDNQAKTTPFQHDNRIMRNRESLEFLEQNLDVSIDPVITDRLERNLLTNVIDTKSGLTSTGGLIMNVGALDQMSYNDLLRKSRTTINKSASDLLATSGLTAFGVDVNSKEVANNLERFLQNINLHEQAGAMNPELYDKAYNNQQFKMLIKDRQKGFVTRKRHSLGFNFKDGTFSYKSGFMKNANELGLTILEDESLSKLERAKGFNTLENVKDFGIKNNVMFGVDDYVVKNSTAHIKGRFINQEGRIVTPEEINKMISGKDILDDSHLERYLNEKGITYDIISSYADVAGSNKFFFGNAEKGTYSGMIPGLGSINPQVKNALEKAGYGDLVGRQLELESLEYYYDMMRNSGMQEDLIQGIKTGIMKERYSSKVLFEDILDDKVGLLFNPNMSGHSHAGSSVGMMMESYASQSEIYKEKGFTDKFLKNVIGEDFKKVLDLSDRNVIMPKTGRASDLNINIKALKQMFEDESLSVSKSLLSNNQGVIYRAPVVNVYDDIAGGYSNTSAQRFIVEDSQEQIRALKRSMANVLKDDSIKEKQKKALIREKESKIKILERRKETAMLSMSNQKGMKITDISMNALNRDKWSQEKLDLMNQRMSRRELERIAKHSDKLSYVDGGLVINESKKGSPMLEGLTDMFRRVIREGQGEPLLGDINTREAKRLKALFPGMRMTKGYAESLETFGLGAHALAFNEVTKNKNLSAIMSKGFIKRNLLDAELEIGGIADTLNIFDNNLYKTSNVFDLGEEFGEDRFLAIEKMVMKQADGRYIKPPHVGELSSLQRMLQQIDDLPIGSEDRTTLMARAKGVRRDIIRKQRAYISGKSSAMSDELFSLRMDRSFRGKGAGMYVPYGQSNRMLDTAMIGDKSIAQRRAMGIFDDAAWMSTQAFEQMGYFEEENIKRILGQEGTRADMIKHLKEQGTLMIGTRQPEIREGSIVPQKVFLNEDLSFNEIKSLDITAKAMNLDHDGDQTAYASLEYVQNKNKYFYDQYVRGEQMPGKAKAYFADIEAGMAYRSAVVNRAYHSVTQDVLNKEKGLSSQSLDMIFDIAEKESIGDVLYSSRYGIDKNIWEIDKDFKKVAPHLKNIKGDIREAASVIKQTVPKESQQEVLNSLAAVYNYQKYTMEGRAKIFASNIGEASVINRNLNEMYDTLLRHGKDTETKEADIFKSIVYRAEEAAIGAKKIGEISSDKEALERASALDVVEKWNQNIKKLYADPSDVDARREIREWIKDRTGKSLQGLEHQEYFNTRNIQGTSTEEMTESFLDTMTKLSAQKKYAPSMKINEVGTGSLGMTGRQLVDGSSLKTSTFSSDATQLASSAKIIDHKFVEPNASVIADMIDENIDPEIFDIRSQARSARSTVDTVKNAGERVGDAFAGMTQRSTGKGLAMSALGIAAGIMAFGLMTGSPIDVNDTQEFIGADYSALLNETYNNEGSVENIQAMQGYIVNINARTGFNQSKQEIAQAVNNMIRQHNNQTNVNMNINNSYETMNQRDINNTFI